MLCHMALALANWEGKRASKALEQADKVWLKPLPQMMPTVQGSESVAVVVVCQVMALTGRQEAFKPFYIRALQVLHTQTLAWLLIIDKLDLQPSLSPASLSGCAVMSSQVRAHALESLGRLQEVRQQLYSPHRTSPLEIQRRRLHTERGHVHRTRRLSTQQS